MKRRLRLKAQELVTAFAESLKEYHASSGKPDGSSFAKLYRLIADYEVLTSHLYAVRQGLPDDDPLRQRYEDYVTSVSAEVVGLQKDRDKEDPQNDWKDEYRRVWRENFSLFLLTMIVFIMSVVLGAMVTLKNPEYASALISDEMMTSILERRKWFESIQENPLLYGFEIAWNNIQVSLNCALFGIVLGLGGLYILSYNGLFFGAIFGFCMAHDFNNELANFVTSHGALELTIIVASAFASFLFGRVFYMRPYRHFKKRLYAASKEAGYVLLGILPWLLVAACLEVFVSPWPGIPFQIKVGLSLVSTGAFWWWTFLPVKKNISLTNSPTT